MKILIDIMGSALDVLMFGYFFKQVLIKRELKRTHFVFINVAFAIILTLISMFLLSFQFVPVFFMMTYALFAFAVSKDKIVKTFVWIIIIYAISVVAEIFCGFILTNIYSINVKSSQNVMFYYFQGIIFSKVLFYFALRAVGFFRLKSAIQIDKKSLIIVAFIPIAGIINCYYVTFVAYQTSSDVLSYHVIILVLLIVVSSIATFHLLEKQAQLHEAKQNLLKMEEQYHLQAEHYRELKENLLETNRKTHDIKNFTIALNSYIDKNYIDEAKAKINEFVESIPSQHMIKTGNDAVNALINHKIGDIKKIKDNQVSIILAPELSIDEIDLCVIIGNAIDNMIEACAKIEDEDKKFIYVKIAQVKNSIVMMFENSVFVEKEKKSFFITTKENKIKHGYGIKNMIALCEKYGGNINIGHDETRFFVNILLTNLPFRQEK